MPVLPFFPDWQKVRATEGAGNLCLYHGDLSVRENEEAMAMALDGSLKVEEQEVKFHKAAVITTDCTYFGKPMVRNHHKRIVRKQSRYEVFVGLQLIVGFYNACIFINRIF